MDLFSRFEKFEKCGDYITYPQGQRVRWRHPHRERERMRQVRRRRRRTEPARAAVPLWERVLGGRARPLAVRRPAHVRHLRRAGAAVLHRDGALATAILQLRQLAAALLQAEQLGDRAAYPRAAPTAARGRPRGPLLPRGTAPAQPRQPAPPGRGGRAGTVWPDETKFSNPLSSVNDIV